MKRRSSIQPAFVLRVSLLAVFIAAAFVFMSFMFLFTAEDEFLERILAKEEAELVAGHAETGSWPSPKVAGMELYFSQDALPDGIGRELAEQPSRHEFYGSEGRHYHVAIISDDVFLVYEVSEQLIIRNMRNLILVTYGSLALLVTVIAAAVAYRLARRTIRPLSDLANHVAAIEPDSPPGNFAQAYPDNEIGELADQLESSLSRLYAFSEREAQFSRDVSHDLRTPLAVATGALELLAGPDLEPEKRKSLVERARRATEHMSLTVSALLSMAREQTGEAVKAQSLAGAVESTVINYGHLLEGKSVELEINVPHSAVTHLADGVLEIILSNILSNAFHYTQQGFIRIEYVDGRLLLTDTAGGIPDNLKASLFQKNVQGEHSSGYGLGLSIVKRLCERHEIGINVEHLDDGTCIALAFDQAVSE